jgi:ABC-type glycerol-3-phosphate transport system permease component
MKLINRKQYKNGITYLALIVIVFIIDFPFFQMVTTSFKTRQEAMGSIKFLPGKISLENIFSVLVRTNFLHDIFNSVVISICSMVFCILIAVIAGYALSRFRGKVFSWYSIMLLMLQLFPAVLLLIPMFVIFIQLRIVDTLFACIIAYTTRNLAFSIWMIKGFLVFHPF